MLIDSSCLWNQFACSKNKCIAKQWLCDGEDDCGDGVDENMDLCGMHLTSPSILCDCKCSFFLCSKIAFWMIWLYTQAKYYATIINRPIIKMQSCFNILVHIGGKQSCNWIVMKCQWDINDIALFLIMANAIKHNKYFSELDKQHWTSQCLTSPTRPSRSEILSSVSGMGGSL